LDAILATVIGGTALQGGRFYLAGSLIGAILIQTLTTTILTRGVPVEFTLIVKALVIVIVCLLQSEAFRRMIYRRSRWRCERNRSAGVLTRSKPRREDARENF